jgi:DNA-binding transcriptional MerR regulator
MFLLMEQIGYGYPVSHLAQCAGATTPRQQELWFRRLRHWTNAGIIETAGAQHGGTGNRRRYDPEAAYLAAVLMRLADQQLPINVLKAVADLIERRQGEDAALWEQAKRRGHAGCIFLGLELAFDNDSGELQRAYLRIARREALNTPKFYAQLDVLIVLNLSVIFGGVRLS